MNGCSGPANFAPRAAVSCLLARGAQGTCPPAGCPGIASYAAGRAIRGEPCPGPAGPRSSCGGRPRADVLNIGLEWAVRWGIANRQATQSYQETPDAQEAHGRKDEEAA